MIECKNLFGNIEVNGKGEFIRDLVFNGHRKKEGIYSPVTQNTRHLEMIKQIRTASKSNSLMRAAFEKYFEENYRSVIVLANPKTLINTKHAPKAIKDQIIRSDQLGAHIKKLLKESKNASWTEKVMYRLAEFFLSQHRENTIDYADKYKSEDQTVIPEDPSVSPLYQALRTYRYGTSQKEGLKAFQIFTNAQLEELVAVRPESTNQLREIPGFGAVKCEKYGEAIVALIQKYQE